MANARNLLRIVFIILILATTVALEMLLGMMVSESNVITTTLIFSGFGVLVLAGGANMLYRLISVHKIKSLRIGQELERLIALRAESEEGHIKLKHSFEVLYRMFSFYYIFLFVATCLVSAGFIALGLSMR